jgi:hypothetical protein
MLRVMNLTNLKTVDFFVGLKIQRGGPTERTAAGSGRPADDTGVGGAGDQYPGVAAIGLKI